MWIKTKCMLTCLLVLLSCPLVGYCSDITIIPERQVVEMSLVQYNELVSLMGRLKANSTLLTDNLNRLEKNSAVSQADLALLKTQLNDSQNKVTQIQASLDKAEISIMTAYQQLTEQQKFLETAQAQVKLMEKTISRLERQRDTAYGVATLVTAYAIKEKT